MTPVPGMTAGLAQARLVQRRQAWLGLACVAPYALLVLAVIFWPFLAILLKSLQAGDSVILSFLADPWAALQEPFSGQNYMDIVRQPHYRGVLASTFFLAFSVATSLCLVAVFVGFFIARNERWGMTVTAIVTFPSLAPAITVIYGVLWLLGPVGPVNRLLVDVLGVSDAPLHLTGTMAAVIVGDFALFSTMAIRMMASLFEMLDPALEAASISLGSTSWQTFRHITLPLVLPGLAAVWIFVFVRAMTAYVAALLLGGGAAGVRVVALEVYSQVQGIGVSSNLGQVCALAVILAVVTVLGRMMFLYVIRRSFAGRLGGELM